jgi:thiol-disulfide isomerase/thioredoxin
VEPVKSEAIPVDAGDSQVRRLLVLTGLLVLTVLWGAGILAGGADSAETDTGKVVAARQLRGLDGKMLSVRSLRGEVVVVNFWATWCKPCKREMPLLDALNTRMQGAGRVIAVSIDRDRKRVARFVEENGLGLPVYVDGPDGLASTLDLEFLPYTLVLDADGEVAFAGPVRPGEPWREFTALVDRLTAGIRGQEGAAAQ